MGKHLILRPIIFLTLGFMIFPFLASILSWLVILYVFSYIPWADQLIGVK